MKALAPQVGELPPVRVVGNKLRAVQRIGKQLLTGLPRLLRRHGVKAGALPDVVSRLNDERAARGRVAVVMRVEGT
jgi:hypothetical protein